MADGSVKIEVILDDSKVDGGVKKLEGRLGGIGGAAKRGIATVGKLAGALGLVALAGKGIDMVKQSLDGAIDRYDTLNNFPRVMEQIGFDAKTSQKAIDKLSDGIQGLPTRLDEVASTAQSIAIMTGDLDGAVNTTLALNNAFLASGASTADAERGLQQYVQMLAKGEVDLQSWRTLQETMPFALRETAEAFGFTGESATNDFYDALKSGDITMSEFNAKLIELDTAQGGFADTAQEASAGIKTAWTNMKTWVVMGVADIIAAIDEVLGGTGSIEGAINSLKPVVQGVFGWIANTAIPAVGKAVGWVRDRFNDLKPTFNTVITALQPLIAVFEETQAQLQGQLSPILDNLKELFFSLLPILQMVATVIGGVLVTAIVIWTTIMNGAYRAIGPLISALINLIDFIVNVVNAVIALLTGDFTGALDYWTAATEASVEFFKSLWDAVVGFVMGIVESVIAWFEILYMTLVGNSIIPDMVNAIIEWFANMLEWLIEIVINIVDGVIEFFTNLYDRSIEIFESFSTFIVDVLNYIKQTFENVLAFLLALVTADFTGMKDAMQNQMENARQLLSNIWGFIKTLIGDRAAQILSDVTRKFIDIKNNIKSKITEAKNELVNKFTEMVTNARNKVTEIVTTARQKFEEVKQVIQNKLTEAVTVVSQKVGEMPGKVVAKAGEMVSAGKDLVQGLIDGIKNMAGSAIEAITGVVGGIVDKAKSLLKINSPSRLFEQFGEWTGEGLSIGIDDSSRDAIKSMANLTEGVIEEYNPEIELLADLKGLSANAVLSDFIPNQQVIHQSIIANQSNQKRYDDSKVVQLLKQLIDKDGNVYINQEKVGSIMDKEQARRIKLLEGWVAID